VLGEEDGLFSVATEVLLQAEGVGYRLTFPLFPVFGHTRPGRSLKPVDR
jgi:hypothetical protein